MRNKILKLVIPFDLSLVAFGSSCCLLLLYIDIPPTMAKFSDVMPKRNLIILLPVGVTIIFQEWLFHK